MVKDVLSCLLKDGKEVDAVRPVGSLFHARATLTQNDRSPMVRSYLTASLHHGDGGLSILCSVLHRRLGPLQCTAKLLVLARQTITIAVMASHTDTHVPARMHTSLCTHHSQNQPGKVANISHQARFLQTVSFVISTSS